MSSRIDIKNKRFGKLLVLSFKEEKNTHAVWNVQCDCELVFTTTYSNLISGNTKSCASCGQTIHGFSRTSFYRRWKNLNKKNDVCEEWRDFLNFKNDTYHDFNEKHRLCRKDSSENYSKSNYFWKEPKSN